VTVPTGKREAVLAELDDEGIDYVVTDETSGREYAALVTFPLPTAAVEPVLERLREAGIERDAYTVVVDAQTVVSDRFERLQEQYAEEEGDGSRIAREELEARAADLAPERLTYGLLTVVSVVIATAGLLLDSPAVVVGSMVIAPLIGPAMSTSVGTVLDDSEMFRRGFRLQVAGLLLAVVSATGFALLVKSTGLVPPGLDPTTVPEIQERIAPDFLALVVALGAGIAGAHSLRSGVSASLVGVMIAVALVPPTAVIGIGIAWGLPTVVAGAAILVSVNALSINLAALVTLWYSGYRPDHWFRLDEARSATLYRIGALVAAIVVLSTVLGGVTVGSYRQATTTDAVEQRVESVVDDPAYGDVSLIDVETTFDSYDERLDHPFSPTAQRVVVTVGRPNGQPYPDLAARIATAVSGVASSATVEVRYVAVDRADAALSSPLRAPTAG
jgi:uncharacterized hydrophobic protein (TIGR00341 family)